MACRPQPPARDHGGTPESPGGVQNNPKHITHIQHMGFQRMGFCTCGGLPLHVLHSSDSQSTTTGPAQFLLVPDDGRIIGCQRTLRRGHESCVALDRSVVERDSDDGNV